MPEQVIENAIVQFQDLAIYPSDIEQICEKYIATLPNPEMVYKTAGFSGMLDAIYKTALRPVIEQSRGTEGKAYNSYNYTVLDNIFNNLYIPLCYKYGLCPTVIQFAVLVNTPNGNLTDIKNGVYRNDGAKANPAWTQTVKNWYQVCESATIGKALNESSIGAMFVAKSVYNYSDQQTLRIETASAEQLESPEQIAARHSAAELPELPELD